MTPSRPPPPAPAKNRLLALAALLALLLSSAAAAEGPAELEVTATPSFFNPSARQSATISLVVASPGHLRVAILDRDGFVIRELAQEIAAAGMAQVQWDGRDTEGEVVPDEAYALRVDLNARQSTYTYAPASGFTPEPKTVQVRSYSRQDGVLSYTLDRPSRVHIQCGQARLDPAGQPRGPVLKTLVDREPRVGGAVVEKWNGFDASGEVYIPNLPDFAVAILAQPLPDHSIITVGNRGETFMAYARRKRPASASRPRVLPASRHAHHAGLNVFEDHSPRIGVQLRGPAVNGRPWNVGPGEKLRVLIAAEGDGAAHFLSQPTALEVFVDDRRVRRITRPRSPSAVEIAVAGLAAGEHRLVVNWASSFGPVGVAVHRFVKGAER